MICAGNHFMLLLNLICFSVSKHFGLQMEGVDGKMVNGWDFLGNLRKWTGKKRSRRTSQKESEVCSHQGSTA
jgi:hypothetical protein